MNKKIIAINLISFNDTKMIGTFVFMKRLFLKMKDADFLDFKFIVYVQKHIDISEFKIPDNQDVEIIRTPSLNNAVLRILFEQTLFYFYIKPCHVLYSPALSMPVWGKWKKILTIHDLIPFVFPKKYNKIRLSYIKRMTKVCAKKADHIVTVSENSKADIMRFLGIDSDKITVIYNFILENEDVCQSQKGNRFIDVGTEKPLKINTPFFVTVSTLQPGKNVEGLITAFKNFSKNNPRYYLYVVGNKGWKYDSIFKLAQQLDVFDRVIFTGYLDNVGLAKLYSDCEGVVYVSFYEGFGIPPLEGFYHGKACVASDTSSLPEVVGDAGILVNPYDTDAIRKGLETFVQNKINLEKNIRKQIAKFNPDDQILRFKKLLSV